LLVEYGPTPTENGVPQGTEISTGVNPGNTNLHLHSEGTPIITWLDELVEVELKLVVLDETKDELAGLTAEEKLDDLELIEEAGELIELDVVPGPIKELVTDTGVLETELEAGDETKDTITLELDKVAELDAGKLEELAGVDELGAVADELETIEEVGTTTDEVEVEDKAKAAELEATTDEALVTLDETAGVADDTDAMVELVEAELGILDTTELTEAGRLLTKLEITGLGTTDEELRILDVGTAELIVFEILLEAIETTLEILELITLDTADVGELTIELIGLEIALVELKLTGELTVEAELRAETLLELELTKLETTTDDIGAVDDILVETELELFEETGDALNTTFNGLLHGIVKSKLIAKKLYCTRHTKPLPDVKV
jgi:hypothetical protein